MDDHNATRQLIEQLDRLERMNRAVDFCKAELYRKARASGLNVAGLKALVVRRRRMAVEPTADELARLASLIDPPEPQQLSEIVAKTFYRNVR